jgi:hypothetical protein
VTRLGPKAPINPASLVYMIDDHSDYITSGTPKRRRLCINGIAVSETDARMIRRWRAGKIKGVTIKSADALLHRYGLTRP